MVGLLCGQQPCTTGQAAPILRRAEQDFASRISGNAPERHPMSDSLYRNYQRLRFDRPHPRVLRVNIDNPGKKNSIDEEMHPEMVRVWHDISYDDSVAAEILTGAGDAFCAGVNFGLVQQIQVAHEMRMKNLREAR